MENKNNGDVIFIHELAAKYFNYINAPHHHIGYTKDRIFTVPVVFFFHKDSRLQIPFNRMIKSLAQVGLIDHWSREQTGNFKKSNDYYHRSMTKLGMNNLRAIFEISGYLYLISLIIFLMEMLSLRYRIIKRMIDFLTY